MSVLRTSRLPPGRWLQTKEIRFRNAIVIAFCAFLLSGCSLAGGWLASDINGESTQTKSASANATSWKITPPENVPKGGSGSTSTETLAPLTAPPGSDLNPGKSGSHSPAKNAAPAKVEKAGGLPVLKPLGVNVTQLFAEKVTDPDDRMQRLENAVQQLRNDFDTITPSIIKLVAIEHDIQDLIGRLETLLESEPAAVQPFPQESLNQFSEKRFSGQGQINGSGESYPGDKRYQEEAANAAPTSLAPAAARGASAPQKNSLKKGGGITSLRIGEHPDKTRLVLDAASDVTYRYDIDNAEKIMVIELPGTPWNAANEKALKHAPLLHGYRVESLADGQGSLLILQLKSPVSIIFEGRLPAVSGSGQRIVLDLKAG